MKTTIELPEDLFRRAKQAAIERGTTLKSVIEDALRKALGQPALAPAALKTLTWPPPDAAAPTVPASKVLGAIREERDRQARVPAATPAAGRGRRQRRKPG